MLFMPFVVYGDSYDGNVIIDKDSDISDENYDSNIGGRASLYVSGGNSTITNSTITKSGDYDKLEYNSGLLINGKTSLKLNNSKITTNGKSSPCIGAINRGILEIDNGIFETSNSNSPIVYGIDRSVVSIKNSKLKTNGSSGIILDRNANLELENVELNINSNNKENILIYDSMINEKLEDEVNTIKINGSNIRVNSGYVFTVKNIEANIELRNTKINTKKLVEVKTTEDNRHALAKINVFDSELDGDIDVDSNSMVELHFNNTVFKGKINGDSDKYASVFVSEDSIINLTEDTYVKELYTTTEKYSNIFLNGHTMYADGKKVRGNKGKYLGKDKDGNILVDNSQEEKKTLIVSIIIVLVIAIIIGAIIFIKKGIKKS